MINSQIIGSAHLGWNDLKSGPASPSWLDTQINNPGKEQKKQREAGQRGSTGHLRLLSELLGLRQEAHLLGGAPDPPLPPSSCTVKAQTVYISSVWSNCPGYPVSVFKKKKIIWAIQSQYAKGI